MCIAGSTIHILGFCPVLRDLRALHAPTDQLEKLVRVVESHNYDSARTDVFFVVNWAEKHTEIFPTELRLG